MLRCFVTCCFSSQSPVFTTGNKETKDRNLVTCFCVIRLIINRIAFSAFWVLRG